MIKKLYKSLKRMAAKGIVKYAKKVILNIKLMIKLVLLLSTVSHETCHHFDLLNTSIFLTQTFYF